MEMTVSLEGKKRVSVSFEGLKVTADQPSADGGQGEFAAPFDLFLASLATCAGFFVQSFCEARQIPTEGIKISQKVHWDEGTHMVREIRVEIALPSTFPEKYKKAVLASVAQCTVKRHLEKPPLLSVEIV